jgi:hypothetical protein
MVSFTQHYWDFKYKNELRVGDVIINVLGENE